MAKLGPDNNFTAYIYMANASKCAPLFQYMQEKGMETQTDTDRMRREDRERDKEINHDGQIEMERS